MGWMNASHITWGKLHPGEKKQVQEIFKREFKAQHQERMDKTKPIVAKSMFIGNPKKMVPNATANQNLHQRVSQAIAEVANDATRVFLNVSAPNMGGTIPYAILQGNSLLLTDVRTWGADGVYSISPSHRVMKDGTFFENGSIPLYNFIREWNTLLPAGVGVRGTVVLPYGEVKVQSHPLVNQDPFTIQNIKGLQERLRTIIKRNAHIEEINLYASSLILGYLRR